MSELIDTLEKLGRSERSETGEGEGRTSLDELGDATDGVIRQERGEAFDRACDRLVGEVHEAALERVELVRELVGGLDELVEKARPLLGEHTDTLRGGLETFGGILARGEAWLRDNPEVVEAGAKLVVLALLAWRNPELVAELILDDPSRLLAPAAVLVEHARG